MIRGAVHGTLMIAMVVFAGCGGNQGPGETVLDETVAVPPGPPANADELEGTIVTATLDEEIRPGTNVVWCATFQLAWNELMDYSGAPIEMADPPAMAEILNTRPVTRENVGRQGCVAVAGSIEDGALQHARDQVARHLPGWGPELLDQAAGFPPATVIMYSMLGRKFPFEHAFKLTYPLHFHPADEPGEGNGTEVATFGIRQYLPGAIGRNEQEPTAHELRSQQIRIIHHEYKKAKKPLGRRQYVQHYVLELLTQTEEDRLILASVEPAETLGRTVSRVMKLMETPNTKRPGGVRLEEARRMVVEAFEKGTPEELSRYAGLLPMESAEFPIVDLNLRRNYTELLDRHVRSPNPKLDGQPWVLARQDIRFRLDEKGGMLESEAMGGLFGGGPRSFTFDRPFLLMLLRKGSSAPYLAVWIGNTELLVEANPE